MLNDIMESVRKICVKCKVNTAPKDSDVCRACADPDETKVNEKNKIIDAALRFIDAADKIQIKSKRKPMQPQKVCVSCKVNVARKKSRYCGKCLADRGLPVRPKSAFQIHMAMNRRKRPGLGNIIKSVAKSNGRFIKQGVYNTVRSREICEKCGVRFRNYKEKAVHHRVPISKGGTNDISNLMCVHKGFCHKMLDEEALK